MQLEDLASLTNQPLKQVSLITLVRFSMLVSYECQISSKPGNSQEMGHSYWYA